MLSRCRLRNVLFSVVECLETAIVRGRPSDRLWCSADPCSRQAGSGQVGWSHPGRRLEATKIRNNMTDCMLQSFCKLKSFMVRVSVMSWIQIYSIFKDLCGGHVKMQSRTFLNKYTLCASFKIDYIALTLKFTEFQNQLYNYHVNLLIVNCFKCYERMLCFIKKKV